MKLLTYFGALQIVMLEDDMEDMLEAEKVHIEHAQQAQLIAEKALQDSMNVNTMLQKQVPSQVQSILPARLTTSYPCPTLFCTKSVQLHFEMCMTNS